MAKRKTIDYSNPPETLDDHPFFGLQLDEEQKAFRDAIWNPEKLVVLCDAKAGCGKTTIAVMAAELLVKYGRYEGIVYVTSPVQEQKIGFLPGTVQDKLSVYNEPFYQAALKAGIDVMHAVKQENMMNVKEDTAYIDCVSHTFFRGQNIENKVVIIDEAQNYYFDELKKTLTRIHDSCKTIVIGHTGQCDLYHRPEHSGFVDYLAEARYEPFASVCKLTHNYRGVVSNWADSVEHRS